VAESTVRTAIYNALDGISNHGMIYDYTRWDADWPTFLGLFKCTIGSTVQIRGWEIGLAEINQEQADYSGAIWRTYTYHLDGFMGLDDSAATEKTWVALVETLVNALDSNATLEAYLYHPPANAVIDYHGRAGALVHHARITQIVQEEV
jgi:hypothetical protein